MSIESYIPTSEIPHALVVHPAGKQVLAITHEGEIIVGPDATPTEAAQEFVKALGPMMAGYMHENVSPLAAAIEQRGYDRAIAEERAAVLAWCERYANNPLGPAKGWSEEHADWFETGCVDTACAIKSAIEAGKHRKDDLTAQE